MEIEWIKHVRPRRIGIDIGKWQSGTIFISICFWKYMIAIEFNNDDMIDHIITNRKQEQTGD